MPTDERTAQGQAIDERDREREAFLRELRANESPLAIAPMPGYDEYCPTYTSSGAMTPKELAEWETGTQSLRK